MAIISGQKAVTTAGTAVILAASRQVDGPLMVKALNANTGNLAEIWVDTAVDGEGVCWLLLSV